MNISSTTSVVARPLGAARMAPCASRVVATAVVSASALRTCAERMGPGGRVAARAGCAARCWRSAIQIVGTPAALLGRAATMNAASGSAARKRSGSAMLVPVTKQV